MYRTELLGLSKSQQNMGPILVAGSAGGGSESDGGEIGFRSSADPRVGIDAFVSHMSGRYMPFLIFGELVDMISDSVKYIRYFSTCCRCGVDSEAVSLKTPTAWGIWIPYSREKKTGLMHDCRSCEIESRVW